MVGARVSSLAELKIKMKLSQCIFKLKSLSSTSIDDLGGDNEGEHKAEENDWDATVGPSSWRTTDCSNVTG